MPARLATRNEVLDRLMESFRRDGYDGASLATLSERTGLGKSSLYHHFPGGKEEMAREVLRHLNTGLGEAFQVVAAESNPRKKLQLLLDAVDGLYDGGRKACLLQQLGASVDRAHFREPLRATFANVMAAFADVARAAGLSSATARRRAEEALVRIEGALVVAAGADDLTVFERTLRDLRASFLRPERR
jgi:TetR/AcrR family transcriptional regulator, lmrAB and yxaGH operons repressor